MFVWDFFWQKITFFIEKINFVYLDFFKKN